MPPDFDIKVRAPRRRARDTFAQFEARRQRKAGAWVSFEWQNVKPVLDAMRAVDDKVREKMRTAGRQSVREVIVPQVKKELQKSSKPGTTGKLYRSVTAGRGSGSRPELRVGTPTVYWHMMKHGGTVNYEGHPYIANGIRKAWPDFIERYVESINQVIDDFNTQTGSKVGTFSATNL